jgi:hypothetical protein
MNGNVAAGIDAEASAQVPWRCLDSLHHGCSGGDEDFQQILERWFGGVMLCVPKLLHGFASQLDNLVKDGRRAAAHDRGADTRLHPP